MDGSAGWQRDSRSDWLIVLLPPVTNEERHRPSVTSSQERHQNRSGTPSADNGPELRAIHCQSRYRLYPVVVGWRSRPTGTRRCRKNHRPWRRPIGEANHRKGGCRCTPRGFTATSEDSQCRDVRSICQAVERRPEIDPDRSIRRQRSPSKIRTLTDGSDALRSVREYLKPVTHDVRPIFDGHLELNRAWIRHVGLGRLCRQRRRNQQEPEERAGAHRIGKTFSRSSAGLGMT